MIYDLRFKTSTDATFEHVPDVVQYNDGSRSSAASTAQFTYLSRLFHQTEELLTVRLRILNTDYL